MITKLKWKSHPVLGDLKLDFTNNGKIYDTIILAGENGSGKTTILDTLSTFLNLGSIVPFDYIEYKIERKQFRLYYDSEENASYGYHKRESLSNKETSDIFTSKYNNAELINKDKYDIRYYGVAYSKARSGFKTEPVQYSMTTQLDSNKYTDDGNDDFTNLKQLIVDLAAQDNSKWMKICENKEKISFEEFKERAKLSRFKNAFNDFFDELTFQGVDEEDSNEKKIIFNKNNKLIPLDSLSTGEKQIVFRGTQLLRNMNSIKDGIVLVDEPELSMHPKWQEKILDYYRSLFTKDNKQFVQMIIATHSEYVIKSALKDKKNVLVIVLKEDNGVIIAKHITAPVVLPTITAAEINYTAFDILSTDYHIQLYGYLQEKTDKHSVMSCDKYIRDSSQYIRNKHFKEYKHGETIYETICSYIRNVIDHPDGGYSYTDSELRISIELLRELLSEVCQNAK